MDLYLIENSSTNQFPRYFPAIKSRVRIMPKVIDYAPPWLSRPFPGASLFLSSRSELPSPQTSRSAKENTAEPHYVGPKRTVARRGNEVFVVVDNQIRWSNLATLKNEWQTEVRQQRKDGSIRGKPRELSDSKDRAGRRRSALDSEKSLYRVGFCAILLIF